MKSIKFTNKQKNIIDFAEYELENNYFEKELEKKDSEMFNY